MRYQQGFIYLSEKEFQLPYLIFLLQMLCKVSMLILNVQEHVAIAVDLLFQMYKPLFQLLCILRRNLFLVNYLIKNQFMQKEANSLEQMPLCIYCYNTILKNLSD